MQSNGARSVHAKPSRVALSALWVRPDDPARSSHKSNAELALKLDHLMELAHSPVGPQGFAELELFSLHGGAGAELMGQSLGGGVAGSVATLHGEKGDDIRQHDF